MSGNHTLLFSMAIIVAVCTALILSTFEIPMLLYDESDIYSCPADHIRMTAVELKLE